MKSMTGCGLYSEAVMRAGAVYPCGGCSIVFNFFSVLIRNMSNDRAFSIFLLKIRRLNAETFIKVRYISEKVVYMYQLNFQRSHELVSQKIVSNE